MAIYNLKINGANQTGGCGSGHSHALGFKRTSEYARH